MDGQNRQAIAVTLCLCYVVRVNNILRGVLYWAILECIYLWWDRIFQTHDPSSAKLNCTLNGKYDLNDVMRACSKTGFSCSPWSRFMVLFIFQIHITSLAYSSCANASLGKDFLHYTMSHRAQRVAKSKQNQQWYTEQHLTQHPVG